MKVVSWGTGVLALLGSGGYLFVYVYRWEWHRALLVGILFLAALVALATGLVLRRLASLEQAVARRPDADGGRIAERLHSAPVTERPFPWLQPDRTHIFIPVLLGGGVVVSGLAWLVERLAGRSARSGVERELAADLGLIAFPTAPLVPSVGEALAADGRDRPDLQLLLGPGAGPR